MQVKLTPIEVPGANGPRHYILDIDTEMSALFASDGAAVAFFEGDEAIASCAAHPAAIAFWLEHITGERAVGTGIGGEYPMPAEELDARIAETLNPRSQIESLATVLSSCVDGIANVEALGECIASAEVIAAEPATAAAALYDAVRYALDRVQTDPEFRWHMTATETLDRLVAAEAAYLGRPREDIAAERANDRQPEHRRRRAACSVNQERVLELELLLEEHGIDVPRRED